MDRQTKQRTLEASRQLCEEGGHPLTPQRKAVLEAVLDLDHPTADEVHDAVTRSETGVSRATVYRALEGLARLGAISRACHAGRAVRYDGRTETHHHLVCLRCDRVVDFTDARYDALPVPDLPNLGFKVRDARVQLRGLCRRCREQEDTL